jgi:hypothetical protein
MKHLKILTTLALGVLASSSGVLQVQAATYNFFVDFSTKEVADFTAYKQTFNEDTTNLNLEYNFRFTGDYYFDSCPTAFVMNMDWRLSARLIGSGGYTQLANLTLPDLTCQTFPTFYTASITGTLSSTYLDNLVNDDSTFIDFAQGMIFRESAPMNGRTLRLENYSFFFDITYDFGTTYLFNYFLSDQGFLSTNFSSFGTRNQSTNIYLGYVYTTAGNDFYYVRNTNNTSLGTTRKKYAVDYNEEFFRGNSVGAGFFSDYTGPTADTILFDGVGSTFYDHFYRYHYLNVANLAQSIVTAPLITFTEESCSGGFLDINVACYVNNAIAYLVNDAPVISDAFTLLNTGIELAAQAFGIIGSFSDDNVFGYLILVGFGFIAIKWFLKNDE